MEKIIKKLSECYSTNLEKLRKMLEKIGRDRGKWNTGMLWDAAKILRDIISLEDTELGKSIYDARENAHVLHLLSFHEHLLSTESIKNKKVDELLIIVY